MSVEVKKFIGKVEARTGVQLTCRTFLVPQSRLTSECWPVQFRGFEACETCELRGSRRCGGKEIRKTGRNRSDFPVPIGKEAN